MRFGRIKNIHFVGIGGIGMSGIADILSNYDYELSGCDLKSSAETRRLFGKGITIHEGHDPSHLEGVDLVVVSSAIPRLAPEVVEARTRRIPVIRRAEMLGEITRLKRGVAVAGTHGKTTTSAMTATVLASGDLDPTLIVGGVIRELDSNARLGAGEVLVVEADEYDRSLLTLHPEIAVVTNIEVDHLDIYDGIEDIKETFQQFVGKVPFYGLVVGCSDDPKVRALLDRSGKRAILYGIDEGAALRAIEIEYKAGTAEFVVELDGERLGEITLSVPGDHNIRNALAAVAVGLELGVPFDRIADALGSFRGVERRFEIIGEHRGATVVDDYGHHPTEVWTTIDAARKSYPDRRIVVIFQPHLYSRTADFADEFAEALSHADLAYVIPIYGAREDPIEGVTSSLIIDKALERGAEQVQLIDGSHDQVIERIDQTIESGDVLITMGAGDVHEIGERLTSGGES